ncbi:MAG: prolyl oligopeptidase family serine peptidase [Candidatus Aminicenantes bacterium]|nr:MAG: prolyl oligopeptidase family serine peptidase [Candidatus Aminicenantes bacterium]
MYKSGKIPLLIAIIFLISLMLASARSYPQSEDLKIFQSDRRIQIDGELDDWEGIGEFPIDLTTTGDKIQPSKDMTITAKFTYDTKNFYAAVKAVDDTLEFPNRSWRYGDGFFLTFLDPSQGNESESFYSFGVSLVEKKPTKQIIYKDGIGFPGIDVRDVDLAIVPDEKKGVIIYELSIPFKILVPFRPFMKNRWAINLIYADRDMGERKLAQLYPDPRYDTEISNKRKGAIFQFENHVPEKPEVQMLIDSFHYYHDSDKTVTLAVHSPEDKSGWLFRSFLLGPGARNVQQKQEFAFKKGMNILHFQLEEQELETGTYDLSVGVIDEEGSLRFKEDNRFFVINRTELEEYKAKFEEAIKGDLYAEDEKFRNSMTNLEVRFDWIQEYMEKAPPHIGIAAIEEWMDEVKILIEGVEERKPAFFPLGSVGRYAHLSEIDGTLQPYSIYVPKDYDEEVPTALFVVLHGSGVDEVNYALNMAQIISQARMKLQTPKMIMIAPQARGFSDWYLGNSGQDVIECINHVKSLYNIDQKNIIIHGFSMGGYGAWRLSLLYPDLFKAAVILSGAISPPPHLKGEDVIDLIDKTTGKKLNYFIVHGAKDNAVPVESSRKAVQKLKEKGIPHEYIEVKDAYHTGYNKWLEIFRWLKNLINQYKRIIR